MELFPGGELVRGEGIGDFPLNAYHVKDDLEIASGKESMSSLFGCLSEFKHTYRLTRQPKSVFFGDLSELEHRSQLKRQPKSGLFGQLSELENQLDLQPKPGFDLNSVPDESNNDNVFLQFQESLKTQQFNVVQNHVVPFEEGDVMMEELTPTPYMVDDLSVSSKEEDVDMEDLALSLNMVYNHVPFEKGDAIMEDLSPIPCIVPDHAVSSEARDIIMEDVTPAPVALPHRVISYQERQVCAEEAEDADDEGEEEEPNIICSLGVMFSSRPGSYLPWTP